MVRPGGIVIPIHQCFHIGWMGPFRTRKMRTALRLFLSTIVRTPYVVAQHVVGSLMPQPFRPKK